jgi:hypothetical protein
MNAVDKQVADILANYGEPLAGNVWRVQGTLVIYHKALERIAAQAKVAYDPPQIIRSERDEAVILVTGRMGDRTEWSIGEALIGVNYRISGRQSAYVYAMAEKRAKDRVILKLVGLHGLLYSEEEADEFRNGRPGAELEETRSAPDERPAKGDARPAEGKPGASKPSEAKSSEGKSPEGKATEAKPGRPAGKVVAEKEPAVDAVDENDLKGRIDRAATINAVTDLMLDPETQKRLAAMPDAERDDVRDHAKARLVALGWPAKRKAAA